MATSSILRNVEICSEPLVKDLVEALETAQSSNGKDVMISCPVCEIKGSRLKELFA